MTAERYDIFVAHARRDAAYAKELWATLRSRGLSAFLDSEDILPGDNWDLVLPEALRRSRVVVVLVGSTWDRAYYLRDEIATAIAWARQETSPHRVVPVWLDGFPSAPETIPYGLRIQSGLSWPALGGAPGVADQLSRELGATPTAPIGPSLPPPPAPTELDRETRYDVLFRLLPAQFEELLLRASAPLAELPPATQPLSLRALSLIQWLDTQRAELRGSFDESLRRLVPGLFPVPAARPGGPELISELTLKNFRSFKDRRFQFRRPFTALVGSNGTGKTAVLEGLATALGAWFLGVDGGVPRELRTEEVRHSLFHHEGQVERAPQLPVTIACSGRVGDQSLRWERTLYRIADGLSSAGSAVIALAASELQRKARAGASVELPLVAYYGTERLWVDRSTIEPVRPPPLEPGSRFDGYRNCLLPSTSHRLFTQWMRDQAVFQAQEERRSPQVESVTAAVLGCVPGGRSLRFDLRSNQLLLEFGDDTIQSFDSLSDGFRSTLALVADIAWRAATLNPQYGQGAARETPGIVLIDELDLHLHPRWQRVIVPDLKRAFPRLQFVVTTHSPFIIQSLEPGEVIDLGAEGDGTPAAIYSGRSIEDIVEDLMGVPVPQRSERHRQMEEAAVAYFNLLDEAAGAEPAELQRLKAQLDLLSAPFSDDPAYVALLRQERTVRLGERA